MNSTEIETIYQENYQSLCRFCYVYVHNKPDAEDFASDSFVKMMEFASKGNVIENPKAWLYTSARNLIYDKFKSNTHKKSVNNISTPEIFQTDEDIEHNIEMQDDYKNILIRLNALPDEQKEAITLHYINELKYSEISVIMNKSVNAVKLLVSKGLKKLRVEENNAKETFAVAAFPIFTLQNFNNLFNITTLLEPTKNVFLATLKATLLAPKTLIISALVVAISAGAVTTGVLVNNSNSNTNSSNNTVTSTTTAITTTVVGDPYAGWLTYKNTKLGYSIRYPSDLKTAEINNYVYVGHANEIEKYTAGYTGEGVISMFIASGGPTPECKNESGMNQVQTDININSLKGTLCVSTFTADVASLKKGEVMKEYNLLQNNVWFKISLSDSTTLGTPIPYFILDKIAQSFTTFSLTSTIVSTTSIMTDPYADWSIYKNSKLGYSIHYPSTMQVADSGSGSVVNSANVVAGNPDEVAYFAKNSGSGAIASMWIQSTGGVVYECKSDAYTSAKQTTVKINNSDALLCTITGVTDDPYGMTRPGKGQVLKIYTIYQGTESYQITTTDHPSIGTAISYSILDKVAMSFTF